MFDFMWNWLPLIGGGSIVMLVLLAVFAPTVLQVAGAWLTAISPLIKGIAEGIVAFFKSLWEGFKDMADNPASIIFVLTVAAVTAWYAHTPQTYERCLADLRKEYRLVPRTVDKAVTKQRTVRKPAPKQEPSLIDELFGRW